VRAYMHAYVRANVQVRVRASIGIRAIACVYAYACGSVLQAECVYTRPGGTQGRIQPRP